MFELVSFDHHQLNTLAGLLFSLPETTPTEVSSELESTTETTPTEGSGELESTTETTPTEGSSAASETTPTESSETSKNSRPKLHNVEQGINSDVFLQIQWL